MKKTRPTENGTPWFIQRQAELGRGAVGLLSLVTDTTRSPAAATLTSRGAGVMATLPKNAKIGACH